MDFLWIELAGLQVYIAVGEKGLRSEDNDGGTQFPLPPYPSNLLLVLRACFTTSSSGWQHPSRNPIHQHHDPKPQHHGREHPGAIQEHLFTANIRLHETHQRNARAHKHSHRHADSIPLNPFAFMVEDIQDGEHNEREAGREEEIEEHEIIDHERVAEIGVGIFRVPHGRIPRRLLRRFDLEEFQRGVHQGQQDLKGRVDGDIAAGVAALPQCVEISGDVVFDGIGLGALEYVAGKTFELVGEGGGAVGGFPDRVVVRVNVVDDFHGVAPRYEAGGAFHEENQGDVEGEVGEGPEVVAGW